MVVIEKNNIFMRTLFIFNHPYDGSFCNALLDAAVNGVKRSDGECDIIHLDNNRYRVLQRDFVSWNPQSVKLFVSKL